MSKKETINNSAINKLHAVAAQELEFDTTAFTKATPASFSTWIRVLAKNWQQGTVACKGRSDVAYTNRKPWKQKGLGRARAGTIRSPLWRGGGVTFAARPRSFAKKVNRKMYRGAMRSILSELLRQERLRCIDIFMPKEPKTKAAKELLTALGLTEVLIITDEVTENLYLSTRNLPSVDVIDTNEINPYSLVGFENVLMTQAAIQRVESWLT